MTEFQSPRKLILIISEIYNLLEEEIFVNKLQTQSIDLSPLPRDRPIPPLFSLDFGEKLHNKQRQNNAYIIPGKSRGKKFFLPTP